MRIAIRTRPQRRARRRRSLILSPPIVGGANSPPTSRRIAEPARSETAALACGRGGAQVEALVRRLLRRDLPARREQTAGNGVVGRPVHRLDAGEMVAAIAE